MKELSQFLTELKRRNVFRAGAAYIVAAWLLVQVADILLDAFSAPVWMLRTLIIALSIGFAVTLVLSWIYEITVEGVKRTEDVHPNESIAELTGRKLDFAIIGVLSVALAIFALDRFWLQQFGSNVASDSYDYSLAVLPFDVESESVAPYLNQLSRDISRFLHRSNQLRLASIDAIETIPADRNLSDIAARLGVRYLVGGIVQLDGTGVGLSISLYDDEVSDMIWRENFEKADLQQTIGRVAQSIVRQIDGVPLTLPAEVANPRAYELYLRARQSQATRELYDEAELLFREALDLDAGFPLALAGLCELLADRYRRTNEPNDFGEAERLCYRAWTVDPKSGEVQRALGSLYFAAGQMTRARESFSAALEINSSDLRTQSALANTFFDDQPDLAERQLKRIIELHPGSPNAYAALQYLYFKQGRYAEAIEPARWAVLLDPSDVRAKFRLEADLTAAGMFDESKRLLLEMREEENADLSDIDSRLGAIAFFQGEYSEAADLFREGAESDPKSPLRRRNLGDAIWHSEGKVAAEPVFRDAIDAANDVLKINPKEIYALSTLVVSYGSVGELNQFQTTKDIYLNHYPSDPYTHYDIAVANSRLGRMKEARLHAQKAFELGLPTAWLEADPDIVASGAVFD